MSGLAGGSATSPDTTVNGHDRSWMTTNKELVIGQRSYKCARVCVIPCVHFACLWWVCFSIGVFVPGCVSFTLHLCVCVCAPESSAAA